MAKRPLTPRESELIATALFVVGSVPYAGHIDRLESLTLRDIADDYLSGKRPAADAVEALDQYIFVRRHRFKNVTPHNLWTLDDRTEQEALRYIVRRPELKKGETLNKQNSPFTIGQDVEFKVDKQLDRGQFRIYIGKLNGYTIKAQSKEKDKLKSVKGWITHLDRKDRLVFVNISEFGREPIDADMLVQFEAMSAGLLGWFDTATLPTEDEAKTAKQMIATLQRRDQPYWFTLTQALNHPRPEHVKRWNTVVNLLVKASAGDAAAVETLEVKEDKYFKDAFLRALRSLHTELTKAT
ncbi:hypothetical protein EVJ27_12895 [Exiguobacterium sp. SH3S2]|uniref:hypothetical protein n=1 Tax=unclassified Exiguobacterium TaxID=2644629 RepID=UPI00103C6205|nr:MULTISPECIES: hypothetical protein [unclassified Exiguobacterium]TCI25526.1 hypothetical protein EVJ32_09380 [Exiguobacterium sp. SH5S4]TCI42097.1 hypothetical protein EVJ28_12790 [Exiguobacterium sp. SH3S3]TCI50274.1 hypothetical protein EVJ30_13175 [Exiguobacterium sp. SH5S13]TCI58341.1 hypothetical protein EVJ27_12895 [Exiguobacterium sp. SH3S2]TCI62633.1 hypothetical protein EVJ26_06905 [Exiguobacterium sp. SH3S1]